MFLKCLEFSQVISQNHMLSFSTVGIVVSALQSLGKSVYIHSIFKPSKEKMYGNLFTGRRKEEIYLCKEWCEGKGEKKQWDSWAVKMRVVTETIRKLLN